MSGGRGLRGGGFPQVRPQFVRRDAGDCGHAPDVAGGNAFGFPLMNSEPRYADLARQNPTTTSRLDGFGGAILDDAL